MKLSKMQRDALHATAAAVGFVMIIAGCAALQQARNDAPNLTTGVKTVEVTKSIPVSCVDEKDIPPQFISSMPLVGPAPSGKSKVAANASGASADVRTLKREHEAMRILLMKCLEAPKP